MDNSPSDMTARWSAGASILAFIPTIVGLMSNSITEITSIADESIVLAIALSISSTTSFNSRFGDRPKRLSDIYFEKQQGGHARLQIALSRLQELTAQSRKPRPYWQSSHVLIYASSLIATVIGAGVWYMVSEITRYGIIVFACPVKANVALWVSLSQLLALLNILWRPLLFKSHTIQVKAESARPKKGKVTPSADANGCSIVLRCPKDAFTSWFLQTFTAIASYTLYAYGTILLASMTLIPASDAVRATVITIVSAGFGRLVVYWSTSPRRRVGRVIVIDVPVDCFKDFTTSVTEHTGTVPW